MSTPPALCDRAQLDRQRTRARKTGAEVFLHKEVEFEIQERLIDVNRTFTDVAIVTGHPDFWRESFPNAKIVSDEDVLDLQEGTHDLVIHAMCLHWANDPIGQLIQARRALRSDGLLLAGFFGGQTLTELRAALGQTEITLTGGLSPRIAPMAEIRDVGGLLQRAGLALPVVDSVKKSVSYRSVRQLMHDLRAMGEGNALAARSGRFLSRHMLESLESTYKSAFPEGDDRIRATFELMFVSGWVPDDSQQKPLRPGSAQSRLSDFLNTPELGSDAKPVRRDEP
ncbi:MAG: methyltransferase domain-containing protein [Litoreibacter sp.]